MAAARQMSPKCFFTAWISGWVLAVYLPSAVFAATGLSPVANGKPFISAIFPVADEVAPAAKIGFAVLFALFMFAARKGLRSNAVAEAAIDMALGVVAMVLTLALLPADWSRGFGVGMTGERFAMVPTLVYVVGALSAGLAFWIAETKCLRSPSDGGAAPSRER